MRSHRPESKCLTPTLPTTQRLYQRRKSHIPARADLAPMRLHSPYASFFPKSKPRRKSSLGQRTTVGQVSSRQEQTRRMHLTADLDSLERKAKTPSPTAFFASLPRSRNSPKAARKFTGHRISLENVLQTPREDTHPSPSPAPYTLELEKSLEQYQLYQPQLHSVSPCLKLPVSETTKTSQGSQVEPEPAVQSSQPFRSHRRLVPSRMSRKDRSPTPPVF